jgi:hypothetical protein
VNNPPTDIVNVDFWADRIAALIKLAEHYGMAVEITGGELVVSRQVSDVFVAQTEVRWRAAPSAAVPAGLVAVPPTTTDRDRIADAIRAAACPGNDCTLTEADCAEQRIQPAAWERGVLSEVYGRPEQFADVLADLLPAWSEDTTTTRADAVPAAECSAQHHGFDDGRLCIRAAQHQGDHIDERGYHWSETVAVYPVADGAWRTGHERLRRLAAETQPSEAPSEPPPVCEGFRWIGQSFATCDRCGQPAWDHAGEEVPVEGAGPFDTRRTVRLWEPGEADRIRAKWDRPVSGSAGMQAVCKCPAEVCGCGHNAGVQTDEETSR